MLNSDLIVGGAGAVIALLFGYFPALRVKFAGLSPEMKSAVMIGTLIITAFGVWGAGCIGWIDSGVACTKDSIPSLLKLIVIAIIANQSVNRIAPETDDVKDAKINRSLPKLAAGTDYGEYYQDEKKRP